MSLQNEVATLGDAAAAGSAALPQQTGPAPSSAQIPAAGPPQSAQASPTADGSTPRPAFDAPVGSAGDEEVRPLVYWLAAKVTEPLRRFTAGSARVDLCRPTVRPLDDDSDLEDRTRMSRLASSSAIGQGARMKLMRDLQLWKRPSYPSYPWLSIGMGCQYEMDSNRLSLQARLKVSDFVTVKVLPEPMVKVQRSLPILNTGLVVSIRYTCPISSDAAPFERGRFMMRVDNKAGSGLHFSPAGVEIDEKVVTLGTSTRLRVAAGINVPRQIPVPQGSPMLGFKIHRLGIKTYW